MEKKHLYSMSILGIFVVTILFLFGCSQSSATQLIERVDSGFNEIRLATNYYRFDKSHFEKSLNDGKVIFLDFHANWCPICARENPKILAAFNELNNADIVGYQVHYNDDETTADDKEMAKKYGITYQYTKLIIDKNGDIALRTLEILDKNRIISELGKVASG